MEISANMRFGQRQGTFYPTSTIKQLVVKLYVEYFKFLCGAMTWYQSKLNRFMAAFNQKFYTDEVQNKVTKIKDIVNDVMREASLETQRTLKATYNTTNAIRGKMNDLVTTAQAAEQLRSINEAIAMQFRRADENRYLSKQELVLALDLFRIALGETVKETMIATIEERMYREPSAGMFSLQSE
jgi:hypothetical protein